MDSPQRSLPDSVATAEPASEDVPMEDQDLLDFDAFFFQVEDVFNDLDKKNPSAITVSDVEPVCSLLDPFKQTASGPSFISTVQKRSKQMLEFVLQAYRYHVPSLPSSRLPDSTRDGLMASLKPCLHAVLRTALAREEFTKECLEKRLQYREEAFPLTLVLCMATTGIVSYKSPGKAPWWMLVDSSGHLLLMKQYLSCIGLLYKEICTPVYMKMKEEQIDVYSYVLRSASMMVLTLLPKQMDACVLCLMDTLSATRSSLVALFISDLLAFVSRIAATSFSLDLIKNILFKMGNIFRRKDARHLNNILVVTCGRLLKEISLEEKVLLVQQYPIRRHFSFWSCFPPHTFLDQPETVKEMWSESVSILREVTAGCPRSAASATFILSRLPLALQCLYNLVKLSDTEHFSHPELKEWQQRLKISFMPVYRIITAVPDREKLPLIQTSLCLLLKLGSLLQFALQDKDITEVLEGIVQRFDDKTFLGASSFVAALGRRRPLRGSGSSLIQKFFTHYCSSNDPRSNNAAKMALLEFSSWMSCEKLIHECGKSIDLAFTIKTFEKQDGNSLYGSSYPAEFDQLFDRTICA